MRVIKEIWSKVGKPFKSSSKPAGSGAAAAVDTEENEVVVRKPDKPEPLEVVSKAFDSLTEHLGKVNNNLQAQLDNQNRLLEKLHLLEQQIVKLPEITKANSEIARSIREYTAKTSELNDKISHSVEQIPAIAQKNAQAFEQISQSVENSAKASSDVSDKIGCFSTAVEKLDTTAKTQTDSIIQMSRTFAVSDRYIKHLLRKQSRWFAWIAGLALAVALVSAAALVFAVIYLGR